MGYRHIENLYRNQTILRFPEVYAMEKIHGTSAHIKYKDGKVSFYSGGVSHESFRALFDAAKLETRFSTFEYSEITVFGEAYGGKCQAMSETYGKELKFVAFEVQMDGTWLDVPFAERAVKFLDLEFVHYVRIPTTLEAIDRERDADSVQAVRNGLGEGRMREGVVLRPLQEAYDERDNRIIVKHKRAEFMETKTVRSVDPDKQKVLEEAQAIADEWVTPMRLNHVVDAVVSANGPGSIIGIEQTAQVIRFMIEDVTREAKGEIIESKDAMKAIGSKTARLFHQWLQQTLKEIQNANI